MELELVMLVDGKGDRSMEEVLFTKNQLQDKLLEWQKRLRLQDWIIKVEFKRAYDFPDEALARVNPTLEKKHAFIYLLDPVDYDPGFMVPYDMENSLIHELLHLHLWPITGNDEEGIHRISEEQAIESITSGILSAYRKDNYNLNKTVDLNA